MKADSIHIFLHKIIDILRIQGSERMIKNVGKNMDLPRKSPHIKSFSILED